MLASAASDGGQEKAVVIYKRDSCNHQFWMKKDEQRKNTHGASAFPTGNVTRTPRAKLPLKYDALKDSNSPSSATTTTTFNHNRNRNTDATNTNTANTNTTNTITTYTITTNTNDTNTTTNTITNTTNTMTNTTNTNTTNTTLNSTNHRATQRVETAMAATAGARASSMFFFLCFLHYLFKNHTNVYFKLIYLRMEMLAWDKRGLRTCLEPQVCFFLYCIFFNYTNEYLKIICLRMETSGAPEKGDGGGG